VTAPLPPDEIEKQGEEALVAEEAAALAATQQLRAEIAAVVAFVLATWGETDDQHRSALQTAVSRFRRIDPGASESMKKAFRDAQIMGAGHALDQLGEEATSLRSLVLPPGIRMAARQADQHARVELRAASAALAGSATPRTRAELQGALAAAQRAVTRTEATARWGVNAAHSAGVQAVAEALGTDRLWVAERDACVHCARYAGLIANGDFPFPGGLTFGKRPLGHDPVPNPPLHPNCRCHVVAWRREWSHDYPRALEREARRSIARGFSLESESEKTRLDAAQRLLALGARLPASVEQYAERAIRTGRFPRGRRFPG
jgi:hypothetical protein